MKPSFYQNRILYILISVLIAVQISAFLIQVFNHRLISEQALEGELKAGERVAHQILAYRNEQLLQVAQILVKDYGFLEAFSTAHQDQQTIESVLENHRNRANAGMIMLSTTDQQMIAQSPIQLILPPGAEFSNLVRQPKDKDELQFSPFLLAGLSQSEWKLFQITHSPLKAPNHIADLTVGYDVDDSFLKSLRKMTNLELMVIYKSNQKWRLHASTLSEVSLQELINLVNLDGHDRVELVRHTQQDYLMLASKISGNQAQVVYLVIAKPLATAVQPFRKVERVLYYLLAVSLLLTVIAIYYVTKKFVEPLSQLAHTDNLTGVGNRRLLTVVMERALRNLKSSKKPFVILLLDLNKFKQINDSMGHDAGDYVLKCVAERVKKSVRATDSVVRLGGDEYAVLLEDCHYLIALKIVDVISLAISQPIMYLSNSFSLYASIGVTIGSESDNIDTMIKRADEAMYEAKSLGCTYAIKYP